MLTNNHQSDDDSEENIEHVIDFRLCKEACRYILVFSHPESLISPKYGWELLLSENYQKNLVVIVIDEAHCILDIPHIRHIVDIYWTSNYSESLLTRNWQSFVGVACTIITEILQKIEWAYRTICMISAQVAIHD